MALVVGTNAFISLADADSYFLDNLSHDSWISFTTTQRSRAIITSASQIDQLLINDCKLPIDPGEIVATVAQANAELALQMLLDPKVIDQSNTDSNTKKVKAGSAEVEFFRPTSGPRFPTVVMNLLKASGCIGSGSAGISGAYASGTCDESSFSNTEAYNKTEGYA